MQTRLKENGPYPLSPWLTSEARCGLKGSPLAGPGRSSHPHPSAHSGSSQRWPTQVFSTSLRGLSEGRGRDVDKLWDRLWGMRPRGNREGWVSERRVESLSPCPSVPAGAVGEAPWSCCGRCTLFPNLQMELPQQCLGKTGRMGSPCGMCAHVSPTLCSSHRAQHGLDSNWPGSVQTIREWSSAAQD